MLNRITYPLFKAFTDVGELATGYKLYTYAAGTTTPITTYSNVTLTTPNTNPIILDVSGEAVIYCASSLKLTLTDEDDVIQTGWPVDNITPFTVSADVVSYDNTINGTLTTDTVQEAIDELIDYVDTSIDAVETKIPDIFDGVFNIGGIYGGNIYAIGIDNNTLHISKTSCMDSTNSIKLFIESDGTTLVLPSTVSEGFEIFIVRYLDGTIGYKAYPYGGSDRFTVDEGAAADATIDAYRFLCFWETNASGYAKNGIFTDDTLIWGFSSENIIKSKGSPPSGCATGVSLRDFMPCYRRVKGVLMGSQAADAAVTICLGQDNGPGTSNHSFVASITNLGDNDVSAWSSVASSPPQWMNIRYDSSLLSISWGDGTFSNTGTADLRIHGIKLIR
jgi:hypothetical protein